MKRLCNIRYYETARHNPEIEDSTESKGDPNSNGGATSAEKVAIASQAVVQPPLI